MKPRIRPRWLGLLLAAALPLLVWAAEIVTPAPLLNDPVAGQALAADVRNARPAADAEFHGQLKIRRRDGSTTNVPIVSKIILGDKTWQAVYLAGPTNAAESLAVTHAPNTPNDYRHGLDGATPASLPAQKIWQPFAGSNFSLADLGLEFFHWPKQLLVQDEMRKGRACHVLESRPAVTNDYSRVLSWVDVETGGLVMAEAFAPNNERTKTFEVKRFKKVNDQWQLQEMEISNPKNSSRTLLQFDVSEK